MKALLSKEINLVQKWPRPSNPLNLGTFFFISNKINSLSDQSAVDFGQPNTVIRVQQAAIYNC